MRAQLFNPFHPNQPAAPVGFVGRKAETRHLAEALGQVRGGKTEHRLIIGERGIGKSSLLSYVEHLARGKDKLPNGDLLQFLTLKVSITSSMDENDFLQEIESHIEAEISKHQSGRGFLMKLKKIPEQLREVNVVGLKFGPKRAAEERARSKRIKSIAKTVINITSGSGFSQNPVHGALLLIDECDQTSPSLCEFLRIFIEDMDKLTKCKLLVIAAGLPKTKAVFDKGHKSLNRVLPELRISRFDDEEASFDDEEASVEFSEIYLKLAKEKDDTLSDLKATQSAKTLLASLGDGHPHYLQRIGSSGFDQWNYRRESKQDDFPDLDMLTSGDIALGAMLKKEGALEVLASVHDWPLKKLGIITPEYREILFCMYCSGTELTEWSDISKDLCGDGFNELRLLEAREKLVGDKVIATDDNEHFCFVERLFVLLFRALYCEADLLKLSVRMKAAGAKLTVWRRKMVQAESAFLIHHIASGALEVRSRFGGTHSPELLVLLSRAAEICSAVEDLEDILQESDRILERPLVDWIHNACSSIETMGEEGSP